MKNKITFGDIVELSVSSTFFTRTLCKRCGNGPTFYFFCKCPRYYQSVQKNNQVVNSFQEVFKRFVYDYYLVDSPSNFNNLDAFNYKNYVKYKPRFHSNRTVAESKGFLLIDCLTCKCRHTVWQFKQTTPILESQARKSVNFYPKKFVY